MDFNIHSDKISMGLFIVHFRSQVDFLNYVVFLCLKDVLILANSVDSDEMQHLAAFHLGLQCLPKYPFRGFQYIKGQESILRYPAGIGLNFGLSLYLQSCLLCVIFTSEGFVVSTFRQTLRLTTLKIYYYCRLIDQ